jgi:hypothetical protein
LVVLPRETAANPSRHDVYRSPEIVFWDDFEWSLAKWTYDFSGNGVLGRTAAESEIGYWNEQSSYSLLIDVPNHADMAYARVDYPGNLYGDYTVVFDFLLQDTSNHWFKVYQDFNVVLVIMTGAKLIQYLGEDVYAGGFTTYQDVMTLQHGLWYEFELRVYPERLQFDVYVSGSFLKSCDFNNNRYLAPDYFLVGDTYEGVNHGSGYWDNIHVAPLNTIPFEEDFEGPFGSADWTSVVTPGETLEITGGEVHIESSPSGVASFYIPFLDFGKHRHYVVTMDFRYTGNHHFFKVYSDPHVIIILNDDTLYSFLGGSSMESIKDINADVDYSLEFRVSAQPQDEVKVETIVNGEYTGKVNGRFTPHHIGYAVFGDTKDFNIYGEAYWGSISIGPDKRDSTWAVCSHRNWDRDDVEVEYAALEYARVLNVSYVRLNFVWSEIEPSEDVWDLDAIKYYDNLLDHLEGMGLDVILIADQWADAPEWAKSKWNGLDFQGFYDEFMEFTTKLATEFGSKTYYYQLLNECNHPGHRPLNMWVLHCADLFEHGYLGVMAGEGVSEPHQDAFMTIVNVNSFIPEWTGWIEMFMADITTGFPNAVDVIAVDHYPGSWLTGGPTNTDWSPLHTIETLALAYDKQLGIMETGYASTGSESEQRDWIYYNLPVIQDAITSWNEDHPSNRYILQAYYELKDGPGGIDSGWGLMHADFTKKLGFAEFGGRAMDFHRWSPVLMWPNSYSPGHQGEGGGLAFADIGQLSSYPDAVFMVVDTGGSEGAENLFKYAVFWDLMPDGEFLGWSVFSPNVQVSGQRSQGGGVAIAQIDNDANGRPDVLFVDIDNPDGMNKIKYRIGWNIDPTGSISSWYPDPGSPSRNIGDAGGHDSDGGGVALGLIDDNQLLDAVIMIADKAGDYRYKIAWNLQPNGEFADPNDPPRIAGWDIGCIKCSWNHWNHPGAGVELIDIDKNGRLDAVFMAVVDPSVPSPYHNRFMYRIAWNIQTDGNFQRWSTSVGLGATAGAGATEGGGMASVDIDGNGKPELVFMSICDEGGGYDNLFKYRLDWNIEIWTIPYE